MSIETIQGLIQAGKLETAWQGLQALQKKSPKDLRILRLSAWVQQRTGQLKGAAETIERIVDLAPVGEDFVELASLKAHLGCGSEALLLADKALQADLRSEVGFERLASLVQTEGLGDKAIEILCLGLERFPKSLSLREALGSQYLLAAQFENALSHYEQALSQGRRSAKSYWLEAHMDNLGLSHYENRVQELNIRMGKGSVDDQIYLGFAMGRYTERLERYDEAFRCFDDACRLVHSGLNYKVEAGARELTEIAARTQVTPLPMSVAASGNFPRPIFIIGMPRTGTTLASRMLSQIDSVQYLGELKQISAVMRPFLMGRMTVKQVRDTYLAFISSKSDKNTQFVIDDMPLNFINQGLIAAAFPEAIIIDMRRNPVDTCMACFKTLFAPAAGAFTYRLEDVANYYCHYLRHLEQFEIEQSIVLNYEQLVRQPKSALAPILKAMDCVWDDSILVFSRDKSPVASASSVQVRRPLHQESLGYTDRYGEALAPLISIFEKNAIHY